MLGSGRSTMLPDVPAAVEQGVPVEPDTWIAAFLPKNAPREIVVKLNAAIVAAYTTPKSKRGSKG